MKEQSRPHEQSEIERHRYLEVLHQFTMNQASLKSVDDICWNIAKTAIGDLGFVDCVVYLLNDDQTHLMQRAAHGDKNPVSREILDPISIPLGQGIVGSVAKTGMLEVVGDTGSDQRYILDDAFRCSELAVPILLEGRVIGVLDSEHPDPNFFSDEDIKLFSTIAALASTRIDTALALERLELQTEQLRRAQSDAEAASEAKSRFLASISHDMRTPLTAILGYAKLLVEGRGSDIDVATCQDAIVANSQYMHDMVGNVLDMAAIESGQLPIAVEPIVKDHWLSTLKSLVEKRAEGKGLALSFSVGREVPNIFVSDRAKITELSMNLLTNAIKYTFEGTVGFDLQVEALEGETALVITVSDTGLGMSPDAQSHIFQPFVRVHDVLKHTAIEGSGLGLSVVRSFVDALNGSITVESALGIGSTFRVKIPVVPDASVYEEGSSVTRDGPPGSAKETALASLSGKCVLFCEDSDTVATLVTLVLERSGATVFHAENGAVGLELAGEHIDKIDVVITDMQMPVTDGYEVANTLRKQGWRTPIIALTAFATKADENRCFDAGCTHFITKPIDIATFPARIAEALMELSHQSV